MKKTFSCQGAGRWFPAQASELKAVVDGFLQQATATSTHPLAIIAPHAGYAYSGLGAGEAFHCLMGKPIERVVVLGASHYARFRGISILSGYDRYSTPLGELKIDTAACETLLKQKPFLDKSDAFSPEHSMENQLPFIKQALPNAMIVPCVVGRLEDGDYGEAGKALSGLMDGKTVLVVSSDFTHYGRSFDYVPFTKDIRKNLEKLDKGAIQKICADDFVGFIQYMEETGATICGENGIGVMLATLQGKAAGRLLKYYTSSDETGDFSHTVCYASIVMVSQGVTMTLDQKERKRLLTLARASMESSVTQKPLPDFGKLPDKFQEECGAFVSLHKNGELRGCIGYILPVKPLSETILEMAKAAALHDNRFYPVVQNELAQIDIEISVLTPPVEIPSYHEFQVGQHGIFIKLRGRQAVFLPQVAVEQKWDKETTLQHLCAKAGLPENAWQDPNMEFSVFEAIVFGEKE